MSVWSTLFTFTVLLCLLTATITFGRQNETRLENSAEDDAHELRSQEMFTTLRSMFEKPILDKDFKTFKQITNSKVYLDFLKQTYPIDKPFKTLAEFVKVAPPNVERYQVFLKEHFENLTESDFVSIHQLSLIFRRADMIFAHAEKTKKPSDIAKAEAAMKEKIRAPSREDSLRSWWRFRLSNKDKEQELKFLLKFEKFVTETEKTDTDWIQAQFEAHGQSDGMLWIAIRKPILMGEILTNCSSTDVFWTWVEQIFILQKLVEFKKI